MDFSKKLYRSRTKKVFAGIFGGLEDYMGTDATLTRIIFLVIVVFSGFFPGVFLYIIGSFIIPLEPTHHTKDAYWSETRHGTN
jgi:phage shock protein C